MKVSIISFDMGHNCLGRAYLLGKVLKRRYDVEILGTQFPVHGDSIWKPCDTGEFNYYTVKGEGFPKYFGSIKDLLKHITGDVIYASKLRTSSFGIGILKKLMSWKPLIVDIDDLETSWYPKSAKKFTVRGLINPIGYHQTRLMEHLTWLANHITTVSTELHSRFGGTFIPHGRDTDYLNPENYDGNEIRREYNLQDKKIIMFLGTPRPHKGLEDVLKAINILGRGDIIFIVIGAGSDIVYETKLLQLGEKQILLIEQIPFLDIPKFLSAADLVIIPQKKSLQSSGQIPAKVHDAMAMAKPIIATDVSDLSLILDGCGIIVEQGDVESLAYEIEWIFSHPLEADELGEKARRKCIEEYSWNVMEQRLVNIISRFR